MNDGRRRFLKVSVGTLGAAAAAEAAGLGLDLRAAEKRPAAVPIKTGRQVPSLCPFCSVGCGQIVMVEEGGGVVDIEGNPDSPINEGTLCPKGAATLQLVNNEQRWTTVKYRAPHSDRWEDKPLDWAMERIAQLVKQTRDATFQEFKDLPDGKGGTAKKRVMYTTALTSLGGATIDNEWNYAQQKLMHALGVVAVENQAMI
jgi:formate dehydrogenase major subunit